VGAPYRRGENALPAFTSVAIASNEYSFNNAGAATGRAFIAPTHCRPT